jgi:hypothetical protein
MLGDVISPFRPDCEAGKGRQLYYTLKIPHIIHHSTVPGAGFADWE